jgi:Ribbon-helix-helix protein, copG family
MERTTVRLPDGLMDQVREEARRRGETLTAFIEDSLRLALTRARAAEPRPRVVLPVGSPGHELMPGIKLDKPREVEAILDEALPLEKRR